MDTLEAILDCFVKQNIFCYFIAKGSIAVCISRNVVRTRTSFDEEGKLGIFASSLAVTLEPGTPENMIRCL